MSIPAGTEQAFEVAAGELGFASAAWLFVREVAAAGGATEVEALRDALGRAFPVLDAVAAEWLEGARAPSLDVDAVLRVLEGSRRVLVVGMESDALDALMPALADDVEIALLEYSVLDANWDRVLANYDGRVRRTDLGSFHAWAGARSAVVTFVYGHDGRHAHVRPAWLRLLGSDVRTQFRAFVGWNLLRDTLYVYPRFLHEHPLTELTALIEPAERSAE
ncbi:MAG: hypothetical protein H6722_31085 [Sandaracinus sp.]|nr:hypothetical protein [Myxococcales bacterium]MCB9604595.1 hypothetical protein [Sandaracinus sp.]MCB9616902.1 hypothetical protein [Sandaracinus sp.]MCB9620710.1 hypothetical protein [Sandaracinus sp.]